MTDKQVKFVLVGEDRASAAIRKVRAELTASEGSATKLAGSLGLLARTALPALSAGALVGYVRGIANGIDALNDLKDATGASIENISALEDVAERTGTSFETVGTALVKFNKVLTEAKPGSQTQQILESIGLSAEELRRIDPAEALRRTAVALAGYADDGDKARIVQELFGKSIKEVAPLLADLGKQTELVAKVTTEQAQAAELFNQQLAGLAKNSKDAARSLLSDLLPSVNESIRAFTAAREAFGGIFAATAAVGPFSKQFSSAYEGLANYQRELGSVEATLRRIESGEEKSTGLFGTDRVKNLKEQAETARKFVTYYEKILGLDAKAPLYAGFGNPNGLPSAPGIPDEGKKGRAARVQISDLQKYIDKLQAAQLAELNLSTVEQARIDIATGKLGKLNKLQEQQVLMLAEGLDILRRPKDLVGPQIDLAELERRNALQKDLNGLLADTPTEKLDRLNALERALNIAFDEGAISSKKFAEAVALLDEQFAKLAPAAQQSLEKVSEFAKNTARSVEDVLGSNMRDILGGHFDSIGQAWANLLADMVSRAIAANLAKALIGDFGTTGNIGGLIGDGLKFFGVPLATGMEYVPFDNFPALLHRGERVLTADENARGAAGGGMHVDASIGQIVVNGDNVSRAEFAATMGGLLRQQKAEINKALRAVGAR